MSHFENKVSILFEPTLYIFNFNIYDRHEKSNISSRLEIYIFSPQTQKNIETLVVPYLEFLSLYVNLKIEKQTIKSRL